MSTTPVNRAKFMSAAGKFLISLFICLISGALLDTVDESGIVYKLLVFGTVGGAIASVVLIIYVIYLALQLGNSEEE